MSLPNPTPSASRSYEQEGSSSSSPWRRHTADSFPPLNIHSDNKHKVGRCLSFSIPSPSTTPTAGTISSPILFFWFLSSEDSDEDLFRVPDVEAQPPSDSTRTTTTTTTTNTSNNPEVQQQTSSGKRRRGRNPVDREYRRLKRLLRNRVSAQQARERKKVYVNDLESRAQELQDRNSKLEEKISTLVNENTMLRKVLMNTRPKMDDSGTESKHDQLGKS
ncbi:hypothetical protein PVL29_005706 [Vitis rotundifolia]|nr:hypothetical protein PVL29_005706 [Vitis rotundifolia]